MNARMRAVVAAAAAAGVVAALTGPVAAAPTVHPVGSVQRVTSGINGSADPREIIATGDALWFTEPDAQKIARMVPGSAAQEFSVAPLYSPRGLAEGPDGAIWFATTGKVSRITDAGAVTSFPLGGIYAAATPSALVRGPDDAMWFLTEMPASLGRIAMDGTITHTTLSGSIGTVGGLALGPDDALWLTGISANAIVRVTLDGGVDSYPLPTSFAQPLGIVRGPDDAMWFAETSAGQVGRIDDSGIITEFPLGEGSKPRRLAAETNGPLWVTDFDNGQIARVTLTGTYKWFDSGDDPSKPDGIAAGPARTMWFADPAAHALGRVYLGYAGAPTAVTATPVNGGLDVSWSAPEDLGVNRMSYYVATASPGGKTCRAYTGTSCRITGLTNGEPYTVRVVGRNSRGLSEQSASSAPKTPRTVPGIPTMLGASSRDRGARLTWRAPASDGGSPVTGYVVREPVGVDCVQLAPNVVPPSRGDYTEYRADCTGGKNGQTYTYRVAAVNAAGTGASDSESVIAGFVPGLPRNVALTRTGDLEYVLAWDAPSSPGSPSLTGYEVRLLDDNREAVSTLCSPGPTRLRCTWTGSARAFPDRSYSLCVKAISVVGKGAEACTWVKEPWRSSMVRNVQVTTTGDTTARVSWAAPEFGPLPDVLWVRCLDTERQVRCSDVDRISVTPGALRWDLSGLSSGRRYEVRIYQEAAYIDGEPLPVGTVTVTWRQ